MKNYFSHFVPNELRGLCLALALCSVSMPWALAQDGNCGNGQGSGQANGCNTQGPQGPQGPPGLQGPAGPQGPAGAQGPAGSQGAKGDKGDKGDTGAAGAQGVAGLQGPKGDTGAEGAVGPKGDTGAAGAAGIQGPKGDTGAAGLQGPKGDKGEKGEQGEPGQPGTVTSVTQVHVTGDRTGGNSQQAIPGGSLTNLVPVAQLYLSAGDYVLSANVDVASTLPVGQQYTCQLKVGTQTDPVDALPIIYGLQTRLSLGGAAHLFTPAQVTLVCGSDAPANLLKARVNALQVDHINPAVMGFGGMN